MDYNLFLSLVNECKNDVCIFGAGDYGSTWVYHLLKDAGFHISFYIDSVKFGQTCNGLPIYSPEYLLDRKDVMCFVSACGKAEDEIVSQLKHMGITNFYHFESEYAPCEFAEYLDALGDQDIISKFPSIMDDKTYLKIRFKYRMGYDLNIDQPKTYNEKLNWLKLYDRNPAYTAMVDKYEVKKIVADMIGEEHVLPLYGVWNNFDEIDFTALPDQFVLKCTHDSGGNVVCKDKKVFDKKSAKEKLDKALGVNVFYADREWVYKNVKPRIIAEKYVDTLGKLDSLEYKFFCGDGKVRLGTICRGIAHDSFEVRTNDHYTPQFERVPFYAFYKNSNINFEKPKQWEEMIRYAEILSAGIPQVRVDFYISDDVVYFGEMTFFTWSGCVDFVPKEYDRIFGDMLILPER